MLYVTGDYLIFLDTDDDYYVYPKAIELLINKALKDNLDIVMFDYIRTNHGSYHGDQIKILANRVFNGQNLTEIFFNLDFFAWNNLFKMSFIRKSNKNKHP